jgi:hypothetical protein
MRGEVLARLLMQEHDISTNQVLFQPKDFFQRKGRKDVINIAAGYSSHLSKETVQIDVSRESFFDILPEALFFHPNDGYATELTRIRALAEQEANARKFLLPYEQLFYWLRLDNETHESNIEDNLESWWLNLTGVDMGEDVLDPNQQSILQQMLPHLSNIVGNWNLTGQWLSLFLSKEVKITEKPPPVYPLPDDLQKRLGEGLLGEDFVIGDTFCDGLPILHIALKGLKAEEIADYLPEGSKRDILENIFLSWMLPVEMPCEISLEDIIPNTDTSLFLGGINEKTKTPINNNTLGLNIVL